MNQPAKSRLVDSATFRLARELTYQLDQAGESGRLAEALARPDILSALYTDSSRYDVLGYWARLREEGFEPGNYYGGWIRSSGGVELAEECRLLRLGAQLLDDLGDYASALPILHRLVEVAAEGGLTEESAMAAIDIGSIEALRGRFAEGLPMLEEGRRLAEETGNRHLIATALRGIGNLHYYSRQYDVARQYWEQDLAISRELDDHASLVKAYGNLGNYHAIVGDLDRAVELYRQSLSGFRQLGDRHGSLRQLLNLAVLLVRNEEFEKAFEAFDEVLPLAEELGDRRIMTLAFGNMAFAYTESGDPLQAIACLERQRSLLEADAEEHAIAENLRAHGFALGLLGRGVEAMEYYERALSLSRSSGADRVTATVLGNMAALQTEGGEVDRATASAEESLAIAQTLGNEVELLWVAENLAELHENRGDHEKAAVLRDRIDSLSPTPETAGDSTDDSTDTGADNATE